MGAVMIFSVVKRGKLILGPAGTTASPQTPTTSQEPQPSQASDITVTDIVGRTVTVKAPVECMLLEGRQLYIVAMLEPDNPFRRVVGWRDDLIKNDLDAFEKYKAKFPEAADIPIFGNAANGEFSVEQAIALEPDVVVLNLDAYQGRPVSSINSLRLAFQRSLLIIDSIRWKTPSQAPC
jgi:ABC-type Fe3+-hydroxamate transport system substrate-binding protein